MCNTCSLSNGIISFETGVMQTKSVGWVY